jgi:hypothetical protein
MKTRAFLFAVTAAAAAVFAASAGAGRVDEACDQPSGGNGATACTLILDESVSGPLGSDVVTACLGEDVFLNLDVHVVAHQLFRPDGSVDTHAGATVHGSGYGLTTGTPIVFNENAEVFIDQTPDGGEIFHVVSPAEVNTQGGTPNLEFTLESQFVVGPDGTVENSIENDQAKCGPSDHESAHLH